MITNPAIVEELRRIADENGGLFEPGHVVEAARNPASPLHSQFEWDDAKASEAYRLYQARHLLIKVKINYVGSDKRTICTRVFVNLTSDRFAGGGYRALDVVLSTADLRKQLLDDALHEMQQFQSKYAMIRELASVFTEMKKAHARLKKRKKPSPTAGRRRTA